MFEYFIAKRYLKSKHRINLITIISIISTLGIMIGVAALIIVISVFNGFSTLVTETFTNVDPHIKISYQNIDDKNKINDILVENKYINDFYPVVEGKVILFNNGNYEVINVKGIPIQENKTFGVLKVIRRGNLNKTENNSIPEIALSFPLTYMLSMRIGDSLYLSPLSELEAAITGFKIPTTSIFKYTALFETNNREYDLRYAFIDYDEAENLLGYKNSSFGYEVLLKNFDDSRKVKNQLETILNNDEIVVESWFDLHKDLYTVMQIERWSAYIILCLIIAIASFNILGSLTMSVMEKKKDIGILKTLGANKKAILKLFTFEGLLIGIIGTISGAFLGIVVCLLQIKFKFYALDPSKYIIDALPVKLLLSDIIIILLTSILLSLFAAYYPARKASSMSVIDSIKWE